MASPYFVRSQWNPALALVAGSTLAVLMTGCSGRALAVSYTHLTLPTSP
jgi:hypothetical protein